MTKRVTAKRIQGKYVIFLDDIPLESSEVLTYLRAFRSGLLTDALAIEIVQMYLSIEHTQGVFGNVVHSKKAGRPKEVNKEFASALLIDCLGLTFEEAALAIGYPIDESLNYRRTINLSLNKFDDTINKFYRDYIHNNRHRPLLYRHGDFITEIYTYMTMTSSYCLNHLRSEPDTHKKSKEKAMKTIESANLTHLVQHKILHKINFNYMSE